MEPEAPVLDTAPAAATSAWRLAPADAASGLPSVRVEAGRCMLGSGPGADVRFEVRGVADSHCLFAVGPTRAILKPLAPKVWINDVPVEGETVIADGDRISVGPVDVIARAEAGSDTDDSRQAAGGRRYRTAAPPAFAPDISALEALAARREQLAVREDKLRRTRKRLEKRAAEIETAREGLRQERETLEAARSRATEEAGVRERELLAKLDRIASGDANVAGSDRGDLARRTKHAVDLNAELLKLRGEVERRDADVASRAAELTRREEALDRVERQAREELEAVRRDREEVRQEARERRDADRADAERRHARLDAELRHLGVGPMPTAGPLSAAAPGTEGDPAELASLRDELAEEKQRLADERAELAAGRESLAEEQNELERQREELHAERTNLERELSRPAEAETSAGQDDRADVFDALAERETRIEARLAEIVARERAVGDREAACLRKDEALAAREAELDRREQGLATSTTSEPVPGVEEHPTANDPADEGGHREFAVDDVEADPVYGIDPVDGPAPLPISEPETTASDAIGLDEEAEDDDPVGHITEESIGPDFDEVEVAETAGLEQADDAEDLTGPDEDAVSAPGESVDDASDHTSDGEAELSLDAASGEERTDDADSHDVAEGEAVDDESAVRSSLRDQLAAMFDMPANETADPPALEVDTSSEETASAEETATDLEDEPAAASFADGFAHDEEQPVESLIEDDVAIDEAATAFGHVPTTDKPLAEAPPLNEYEADVPQDASEPAAEEESSDSVSDYMEKLLARMRNPDDPAVETPAPKPAPAPAAAAPVAADGVAEEAAEAVPDEPPQRRERKPIDHEALRAETDSFREMANLSARTAIARHSVTKQRAAVVIKGVMTVAGGGIGLALVTTPLWSDRTFVIYGLAAFAAAGFAAYDLIDSVRGLNEAVTLLDDRSENDDGDDGETAENREA